MKNDNYILIYDDKCPMCVAYTSLFVKWGILNASGRKSFTTVSPQLLAITNESRSKNEIPLIDTATNKVYYGIDALLELLNTKIYGIKAIGKFAPINFLLKKLYSFISYNRKVITAVKCSNGQYDCSPTFNYKWRSIFLITFLITNTLMLFPVQTNVLANSIFSNSNIFYTQLLHTILVCINIALAFTLPKHKAFEYLGQVNMLAILTIASLSILMCINKYFFMNSIFNNIWLLLWLFFIVIEYVRRMTYAGVIKTKYITLTNLACVAVFLILLIL
jgi:predicted DCC family thiol-disulfide oxidoreductase YuxK